MMRKCTSLLILFLLVAQAVVPMAVWDIHLSRHSEFAHVLWSVVFVVGTTAAIVAVIFNFQRRDSQAPRSKILGEDGSFYIID